MQDIIAARIDWLRWTTDVEQGKVDVLPLDWPMTHAEGQAPVIARYRMRDGTGGLWHHWTPGDKAQGGLWTMTGEHCDAGIANELNYKAFVSHLLSWRISARFARIDLALDIIARDANIDDAIDAVRSGTATYSAKKYSVVDSETKGGGDLGKTLYLGSRKSDRFVRIYDKRRERARAGNDMSWLDGREWVRIEVQASGRLARAYAERVAKDGVDATVRGAIRDSVTLPSGWFGRGMAGALSAPSVVPRKKTNSDRWLFEVATPRVVARAQEDQGYREWLLLEILKRDLAANVDNEVQ